MPLAPVEAPAAVETVAPETPAAEPVAEETAAPAEEAVPETDATNLVPDDGTSSS